MGKIISLDIGDARVGCAVADEEVRIAFPRGIWPRSGGRAEKEILNLIDSLKPAAVIVGLPLGPDGEQTPQCEKVKRFVSRIVKRRNILVSYVDESYSSVEAGELLRQGESKTEYDDASAACIILNRFWEQLDKNVVNSKGAGD